MSQGAREVPREASREVELTAIERRVVSEGNDLGYHVLGALGEGRSPVLLANGLGGSWRAWSHQLRHFLSGERSEAYQFVSWDYRGLYASKRPSTLADLDPKSQARDALAILDREGIEKTAVFGWSMGVQVALELVRLAPDRVSRIVLINGVAGRPWDTLANAPALGKLAPGLLRAAGKIPGLISASTMAGVGWPHTPAMMQRLGLIGRTMDLELFHTLAAGFGDMDMEVYIHTLRQLGDHDAHDVLHTIEVPVLLIAGARDLMTPRAAFERIASEVPNAELLVVPGGTHYVAVEYPEVVNLRIERFFRQHPTKRAPRETAG